MCDPVTIGGMVLSAAGSAVNGMETANNQRRQSAARSAAAAAEYERQRRFSEEGRATFDQSVRDQGPDAARTRTQEGQAQRRQALTGAVDTSPVNTGAPVEASAPNVVRSEIGRRVGDALGGARREATNLANLTGYDDGTQGGAFAMSRANNRLADTQSMAAGSAAIAPLEMEAAYNNAYRNPSGIGDLLGLAGRGVTLAGATGWNPFGRGAVAPSGPGLAASMADPTAANPFWRFGAMTR